MPFTTAWEGEEISLSGEDETAEPSQGRVICTLGMKPSESQIGKKGRDSKLRKRQKVGKRLKHRAVICSSARLDSSFLITNNNQLTLNLLLARWKECF